MTVPAQNLSRSDSDWKVPAHTITEFRPRACRYCVCIFVINEGERIREQLKHMRPFAEVLDILIADGGSSDGSLSPDVLRAAGVRALLVKNDAGKLSAQMRMGFAYALQQGYEGVITMDGNNKDDPGALPLFIQALDQGFDHVQGSRFIEGGIAINTPRSRLLGIRLVHAPLISLAAGFHYTDTTNGFRAYSRKLLCDPMIAPFREVFSRYELHYYLAIRAARLGYKVKELPVMREYPAREPAPTKIRGIGGKLLILRTLLQACLHRFDPPRAAR